MEIRCPLFNCRFYLSSFFLLLTFSLSLSTGLVTESTGAEKFLGSEPGWSTFLRGGYVHQFDSDIDSGGDFNIDRLALQGGVSHANDNGRIISLALGYGTDRYDFSGNRGFAGLRPWDNIHSFRLSVPVRFRYDNHWSIFVMPTVRTKAESNADFDEGVSGPIFSAVSYKFNDQITVSLLGGVELGGELRLEDEKGNLVSESDYDSAAFLGFTFYFRF